MNSSRPLGGQASDPSSIISLAKILVNRINPFGRKKQKCLSKKQVQIAPDQNSEKDTLSGLKSGENLDENLKESSAEEFNSNVTSFEKLPSRLDISEKEEEDSASGDGKSMSSNKESLKDIQNSVKLPNFDENKTPLLRTFTLSNSISNLFSPLTKRFTSKPEIANTMKKSSSNEFTTEDFKFLKTVIDLERENLEEEIKAIKIKEAPNKAKKLSSKWSKAKHNLKSAVKMKKLNDDIKSFGTSAGFAVISDDYLHHWEKTLVKEAAIKEKIRRKRLHLFYDTSRMLNFWDFMLIYLMMYNMFVTSFRIAFGEWEPGPNPYFMLEIFNDILYIFDIIISVNTVIYDLNTGKIIERRAVIIKHYFKNWFLFDILALFPFDFLDRFSRRPWDYPGNNTDLSYWHFISQPQFFRLVRLLRLFKLIKKVNSRARFARVMDTLKVRRAISKLLSFFFSVIVCIHNIGCIWYFSARIQGFTDDTWVSKFELIDEDIISIYIKSIYWAFMTLSTVGYGDIHAVNDAEYFISLLWMMFGLGFYSYTVGSLSNLLGSSDSRSAHLFRNILIADEFCKDSRLNMNLKKKIHTALTYSSYKNIFNGRDKDQFLNDIPVDLKFRVAENLHKGLITDFPFFQDKEKEFIAYFVPCLSALHLNIGEVVYKKGEHPNYVYFLIKGRVNFVCGPQSICFKTLVEKSYFGEMEIFHNTSRLFSARAQTECNLLTIKKTDFLDVLSFFQSHRDSMYLLSKNRFKQYLDSFNRVKEIIHISKNSKFWELKRTTSLYDLVKDRRYDHNFSLKGEENNSSESPSLKKRIQSIFGGRISFSQQNIRMFDSGTNNNPISRKSSSEITSKENGNGSRASTPLLDVKQLGNTRVASKSVDNSRRKLLNMEGLSPGLPTGASNGLIQLRPISEETQETKPLASYKEIKNESESELNNINTGKIQNDLLSRRGVETVTSISTFGRRYSRNSQPSINIENKPQISNETTTNDSLIDIAPKNEKEAIGPSPVIKSRLPPNTMENLKDSARTLFPINECPKRRSLNNKQDKEGKPSIKVSFPASPTASNETLVVVKSYQAEMKQHFSNLRQFERKLEQINDSYGELKKILMNLEKKMSHNNSKTEIIQPPAMKVLEINDFDDLEQKPTL